jgi:hypothetical protein
MRPMPFLHPAAGLIFWIAIAFLGATQIWIASANLLNRVRSAGVPHTRLDRGSLVVVMHERSCDRHSVPSRGLGSRGGDRPRRSRRPMGAPRGGGRHDRGRCASSAVGNHHVGAVLHRGRSHHRWTAGRRQRSIPLDPAPELHRTNRGLHRHWPRSGQLVFPAAFPRGAHDRVGLPGPRRRGRPIDQPRRVLRALRCEAEAFTARLVVTALLEPCSGFLRDCSRPSGRGSSFVPLTRLNGNVSPTRR